MATGAQAFAGGRSTRSTNSLPGLTRSHHNGLASVVGGGGGGGESGKGCTCIHCEYCVVGAYPVVRDGS